ncbi:MULTISPECIES: hypothetical protein [unclassified Paenarthrobacter]|uniref:hypothetical protein n=1 Tax=unclassified Paenarthrobacter TaxID=2634190 RepID=UPI00084EA894|nr:hypothetical protein [Paenarthrobacter sp. R1]NKR13406.1 hypothetical protein [Arthrobacter sp. M5]NKR16535.1 hypothetical protein [Arthrobacter sp. M6]OEH58674.1 hypothetical protein A5N17_21305 [Arthrobacter sp. D2]OEH61486.1 hypothetical protein A5N13_16370 [Arthrobacter sp. D4]WIV29304.1 hypothetical protein QN084_13115 [Paenarthrobacter sp. R1]
MNATPITAETIALILGDHGIPAELHADPEIQAAAYGLAFLNSPATPAEGRFYGASTVFYDEEDESRYEVSNRDLLEEQLTARLSVRIAELG